MLCFSGEISSVFFNENVHFFFCYCSRQMFAEHLDVYNLDQNSDSEHSVDACLEDTGLSELVNWANKKNKGTNLDPEVRKRKPVSIHIYSDNISI